MRPSAVVDSARLSPVQQIALGLRTATPQGPPRAAGTDTRAAIQGSGRHEAHACRADYFSPAR